MPTTWLTFPGDLQHLTTLDDDEAEAVCWQHCQHDDEWKVDCFSDNCPLGQIEAQRLEALIAQRNSEMQRLATLRKPAFNPLIPFSATLNSVFIIGPWSSKRQR
jgi:hypothetical protein